jgi:hypothetical protein
MVKQCIFEDCINECLTARARYCGDHNTPALRKKAIQKKEKEEEERLSEMFIQQLLLQENEQETKLRDDRVLRSQQEVDYEEAVRKDTENMKAKEADIQRKAIIRQKFEEYIPRESDVTVQLTFPQLRLKLKRSFPKNCPIKELFDFVDIVLEDHNVSQTSPSFFYQIIVYPNQSFTKKSVEIEKNIEEFDITHNSSLSICIHHHHEKK